MADTYRTKSVEEDWVELVPGGQLVPSNHGAPPLLSRTDGDARFVFTAACGGSRTVTALMTQVLVPPGDRGSEGDEQARGQRQVLGFDSAWRGRDVLDRMILVTRPVLARSPGSQCAPRV